MGFIRRIGLFALAIALPGLVPAADRSAKTDLDVARRALRDGIWHVALSRADEAFAHSSESDARAEARLIALEALSGEGRFTEALERLDAVEGEAVESEADALRYWRGWLLARLGRALDAKAVLETPFPTEPWRSRGELLAARTLFDLRENDAAAARLKPLLKDRGGSAAKAKLMMGEISASAGKMDEAKSFWNEIVQQGDSSGADVFAEASRRLGEILWKEGRTNETVSVLLAGYEKAPDAALKRSLQAELGFAEMASTPTRAKGLLRIRSLLKDAPDSPQARDAQLRLADCLLELGYADSAQAEYLRYLEAYPSDGDDAAALEGRAWALMKLGRNSEAAGAFAIAARHCRTDGDRARCLFKQGDALKAEKRYEEAAKRYEDAASADPAQFGSRGRFAAAEMLSADGLESEAVAIWTELSMMSDEWAAESSIRLASRAANANRTELALKTYESVIMRTNVADSVRLRARAGRGRALYNAYRFDEAAAEFRVIEATDPSRAETMRFMRALCSFGEGRDQEAGREVQAIFDSTHDPVLKEHSVMWLARMAYNSGEWQKAESLFSDLASMTKDKGLSADARVWAAKSAFQRNEFNRAVELVAEASKTAGDAPALKRGFVIQSEALMELASYDEAVIVLDRAISREQEPDALRHLSVLKADALFAMGADNAERWEEALGQYRTALGQGVPSPSEKLEIAFKIGRSLEKLRRADEATEQYYVNVVMAYCDARREGVWFDASARMAFSRAAFALADSYEGIGDDSQAVQILKIVVKSGVSAKEEALRRIENIRNKGRIL